MKDGSSQLIEFPTIESAEQLSQYKTIKWLHCAAFVFFLIQTVIYCSIGIDAEVLPTVGVPTNCGGPICPTRLKTMKTMKIGFLIPLFTALACVDHLVCFLLCQYKSDLCKKWIFVIGSNPLRWIEYSISASVMAVAVAILTGITDVHLWLLIFFMTAVGIGCGQIVEILPRKDDPSLSPVSFKRVRELAYALGTVSIFMPWLVICCYIFRAISEDTPDFVYVAFLGTLVLFIAFGVNSFLNQILRWYDFPTAEIVYIALSFTAKAMLAGDVCGGFKASEFDDAS